MGRIGKRRTVIGALADLRRSWGQLLLVSFTTRLLASVLLLPILALALRFLLNDSPASPNGDPEIIAAFLTPVGRIALLISVLLWLGVAFIEQAGLLTIAFGATQGRRLTWLNALRYVISKLRDLVPLFFHLMLRVLLVTLPFVIAALLVLKLSLAGYDINYFILEHLAQFVPAALGALGLFLLMLYSASSRLVSWLLAMPAVLFENLGPVAAIKDSVEDSRGHRWQLAGLLTLWFLIGTLAGMSATIVVGIIGWHAVDLAGDSAAGMTFIMAATGLLAIALNTLISFIATALFALSSVRIYRFCSGPGELPELVDEAYLARGEHPGVPHKRTLLALTATMAVACALAWLVLSGVKHEEELLVIAHRGASAVAPENTLAAVEAAIDARSDYIEIDVQQLADDTLAIFHDENFSELGDSPLLTAEATLADIKLIDIGSWFDKSFASERVPTLDQVLERCKGRAKLLIELKFHGSAYPDLEKLVAQAVEAQQMQDDVMVMSFNDDRIAAFKSLKPGWKYGQASTTRSPHLWAADVDFLAINRRASRRLLIARTRAMGFEHYVYTVNEPMEVAAMISRGADGIVADDPARARQVLEMRRGLSLPARLLVSIGAEVGTFTRLE